MRCRVADKFQAENENYMKLNYKRTILVGFAFFLISAFWQAYDAIIPLILMNHFGLDHDWSGGIMAMDNVIAVFLLPVFGALSDKISSKFGKRTPFIFIGTILAVIFFVSLPFADNAQLKAIESTEFHVEDVESTNIEEIYDHYYKSREEHYDALSEALKNKDDATADSIRAKIEVLDDKLDALVAETSNITKANAVPMVAFIILLMFVLLSMSIFRSPAVALMPDVTVKPLRSKGNAVINLMGTAGGIVVLGLGFILGTGNSNPYMNYTLYIAIVAVVMIIGLIAFLTTVKENKWAKEMELASLDLVEDKPEEDNAEKRRLSKSEVFSLIMILASVALWYIGYNSVISKYSVYATRELGFDYFLPMIVAQAAAVISYIPVGIISSKIGRKKAILAGVAILATAFFLGHFITPMIPEFIMFFIFILAGIGWATINVNSFPMVVELAKGSDVGKYTGYYYTASMAAQIIAPILSGILYKALGMREIFFPFAVVFVVLSFITMLFVKHGDSKPEKQGALESLAGAED